MGRKQGNWKKRSNPHREKITESQIIHVRNLAAKLNITDEALRAKAGKPLEELSKDQGRELLKELNLKINSYMQAPSSTKRKRARLPEGIDKYELNYLMARQKLGDLMRFVLLTGEEIEGIIAGFSPYFITVKDVRGQETTVHKMALAYYQVK